MRNRIALVGVLAFVVILLLWNFAFYGPAGRDRNHAKQRRDTAEQQGVTLAGQLRQLQQINANAPEQAAKLGRLNAAVPPTPDLEGFIRSAVDLEQQAGVDWVDIEPSQPAPGPGASQIKMTISIAGGFFQVLDYLNRVESLTRIVVVDSINITTGGSTGGSTSGTTPTTAAPSSGAPQLTVTLNARMFTQATPTAATGPGTGSTGGTTPSTGTTPTTGASK